MLSFFLVIKALKDKGRKRIQEKKNKLISKLRGESRNTSEPTRIDKIKSKQENELQEEVQDKESKIKRGIYLIFAPVVAFFETLPLFLVLTVVGAVLICVVIIVIVISSFMGWFTESIVETTIPPIAHNESVVTPIYRNAPIFGEIQWTDNELASSGMLLTDYEKNLYRLGILFKKALTGYYGNREFLKIEGTPENLAVLMMLGVSSTETSMNFYSDGALHDITKIPSNIPLNSKGYGFLGLHGGLVFKNQFNSSVVEGVSREYTPKGTYSYDAQFAPWGALLSAQHMDEKMKMALTQKEKVYEIIDSWGIVRERELVAATIFHFLAQAQYHGAKYSDYTGYVNFWAAMYHATGETDLERSFDRWTIVAPEGEGYDESSFRTYVLGKHGKEHLHKVSTPLELEKPSGDRISLNGVPLTQTLWGFIWERYSDKEGVQESWRLAQHYSSKTGGEGDRVLNFHYGFNSFLQANRVKKVLELKLLRFFEETPGVGQAIVDGKPTLQYISEWYNKASSTERAHMDKLVASWGTSSHLREGTSPASIRKYKDKDYGVPFYGQGASHKEIFGTLKWHPNSPSGWVFNKNGCMVYSHSYAVSALLGRLINPAELASIMIVDGSLLAEGIYSSKMVETYKKLGLNAELVNGNRDGISKEEKEKVRRALQEGAVVVVRAKTGIFTSSENHFITLTSVKEDKNGGYIYFLYSSSKVEQSNSQQGFKEETLFANLHKEMMIVRR